MYEAALTKLSERERDQIRRTEMGARFPIICPNAPHVRIRECGICAEHREFPGKGTKGRSRISVRSGWMRPRMHHRPFEMCGGEQQRTAIARAIAHRPKLLLADEPTAELDSRTGLQMIKLFRDLVQRQGMTVILSTHDPAIMRRADGGR